MLDEMGELTKKTFCTHSNRKLVVTQLNGYFKLLNLGMPSQLTVVVGLIKDKDATDRGALSLRIN